MSSKTPSKLVGGLLAGLLALFAAVVVATPAWATGGGNIYATSGTYELDAVFGAGNYTLSGTTITLKKDASIEVTDPVVFQTGSWILNMNGATLTNESTLSEWPGHGSVNNSLVQVQKGATLAINGEGTITGTGDTSHKLAALGVYGTCTVEGVALSGGGVNAGSDTIMPAVAVSGTGSSLSLGEDTEVSCAMSNVNGPAVAAQGGSSLTIDGAEITTTPDTAGCAVMVGDDDESASLTMKSGTLNGNIGICVDANASVDVQGGTINLTGSSSAGQDHLAAIYVQAASPATEANADINISDVNITGQAGNVICADSTISSLGNKASTSVDISGGDLNGGFSLGTGNNISMQVSGGTYSAPVDPTWLADSVNVMSSNDDGQVSYYPSAADVPEDETSTPVSNAPIQIMGSGLIGSDVASGDTTITDLLTSLGVTGSLTGATAPAKGPNLWVVWYGAAPSSATVSFSDGSAGATFNSTNTTNFGYSGQVGLAFVELGGTSLQNAPAGTYKIQVANGANTKNAQVQVASLTTYNPSDEVSSMTIEGEATTAYYNVSDEPLEKQPTPTAGNNTNAIAVGWYELTPTTVNGKTTYTAALWTEDEYVPSTAANTILMAAYTQPFQAGDITANLAIDPTNLLTIEDAGTATLTLTIGEDALQGASIVLAQPDDDLNITNEDDLDVTMADLATSVANIAKAGLTSANIKFNTYGTDWTTNTVANASATLAEAPEGQSNPSISGATVTATLDLDMSGATAPTTNPVAMTINLNSALHVNGTMSGTNTAPVVSAQPAATFNLYTGVQAATQGYGTITQTVNADGTVTLTATPINGSTFVGWQAPLGTTIFTTPTITLSEAAVAQLNTTLGTSGGTLLAVFQGGTAPVPPAPEGDTIAVYRLYNTATQEHLLTSSTNEVADLLKGDWILDGYDANKDGIAFYALPNSEAGIPVYRVYDYGTGTHMYTTSLHEVTVLVNRDGWHWDNGEQPIFTTPATSSYKVYRLYNGSLPLNVSHLWTASWNEFNTLRNLTGANKWTPEPDASGVAWFACGVPTGPDM